MKKLLLYSLFLGIACMGFANNSKTVKITLKLSSLYGGGEMLVYSGSYDSSKVMKKISTAQKTSPLFVTKEALAEGKYIIDVYNDGLLIQTYTVSNPRSVYDKTNGRFLKCDVLSDIYFILVHTLLRNSFPIKE
jgi:predicted lipoprotein with Yx(FWY)xxD motif